MIAGKSLPGAGALLLCAVLLAGCVSLLPKQKPAQLYRFDNGAPAAATPTEAGRAFGVFKGRVAFDRAAAGDRILTVNGQQVAYIAEARWAAPAVILFDQALSRAFDDSGGPARLVGRGQSGNSQYVLQLDVRDFAAVYEAGPESAPVILVRIRASLTRQGDRALIAEQTLESRVQTSDNRVSAIAAGFDKAVTDTLGKLIAWTNASAKSA